MKRIYLRLPMLDKDGAGAAPKTDPKTDPKADPKEDPKADPKTDPASPTYTQDQLDAAIEAKLAEARKKAEQEKADAVAAARAEAERLAKLPEEERAKAEREKAENDLKARLDELNRRELLADAKAQLAEKSLPASFAEILVGADAEKTAANIENFAKMFSSAVEAAVNERLKGKTPGKGDDPKNDEFFTKEQVAAMSQDEVSQNLDKIFESMKHWNK